MLRVYIDDSGSPSPKDVYTELFSVAAVAIPEDRECRYSSYMEKLLEKFELPSWIELHAWELFNPRRNSFWRRLTLRERVELAKEILKLWIIEGMYEPAIQKVFFTTIRKGEDPTETIYKAYTLVLGKIFREVEEDFIIVVDEGSKGSTLLDKYYSRSGKFLGSYRADSFLHRGLQLADLLAYILRRYNETRKPSYIFEFESFIKRFNEGDRGPFH